MRRGSIVVLFIAVASVGLSAPALADVPAGYTGTPHKGTPWPIPGRVNMVDYDVGGKGVGFDVDHDGDSPCNGFDYRTDTPTVTLCKTGVDRNDKWTAGPLTGTTYPSATTTNYYIGAIRPGDWVNITVNVQKAGTYSLSTDWASDFTTIDVKISFNGVLKNQTKRAGTGGYHNWIPAPNFGTVQLDAGIQVMRFESVVEHVNPNYILFTLVGEDGGVAPDASSTGSAGVAGTDAGADAASGVAGTSGSAGVGGAGTTGTGGTTASGTAGTSGAAGSFASGTAGTGGGAGSGPAGTSGGQSTGDDGGCACATASRPGSGFVALLALTALGLVRRRRSRAS